MAAAFGDKTIDFTKKWPLSDGCLKGSDSNELLYVNKSMLAIFSPYFQALFFGEFKESKEVIVNIDIEYKILHEILKILHHVDRKSDVIFSPNSLKTLYKLGDRLDIPPICDYVVQSIPKLELADGFKLALELGLNRDASKVLFQMDCANLLYNLQSMTTITEGELIFKPEELHLIIAKFKRNEQITLVCRECFGTSVRHTQNNRFRCADCDILFELTTVENQSRYGSTYEMVWNKAT